ncbi:hypothetical protein OIU84_026458 [Salix udensis]|uniref:DOG1 domain-containing protein n=1 Tax=Salix udensis TaxID=889485 RepID=A0AAD6KMA2_9ROSI|nr:hypothetical protein OIU84_026458 [Salix udensis]
MQDGLRRTIAECASFGQQYKSTCQKNELRLFVDNCLAHYDEMINLKSVVAKTDVFHLVSGMWKTPAERCFMWMGGFRPSELIKIIVGQIEPLTEQQILGIYGLQQSTQENEDALSQGLEALNQSLSDTIAAESLSCPPNMANYMGQMAVAMNKLSALEGFVRQRVGLRLFVGPNIVGQVRNRVLFGSGNLPPTYELLHASPHEVGWYMHDFSIYIVATIRDPSRIRVA